MARTLSALACATKQSLLSLIRLYRYFLSGWLGRGCRFSPSCSQYSETALQKYGVRKGIKLTCFRLLRCHPWAAGGEDNVP